jgi:hypothetical protein
MAVDAKGHGTSSGSGLDGLLRAWRGLADLFEVELPRLFAVLFRFRG